MMFGLPAAWAAPRNPRSLDLNDRTASWIRTVGFTSESERIEAEARTFDPAAYAGWLFPGAEDQAFLQAVSDFVMWDTALDDHLENFAPTLSPQDREALADDLARMVEGRNPETAALRPYVPGWRDLVLRFDGLARSAEGGTWPRRFRRTVERTFRTVITQTPLAAERWLPVEQYAYIRPWESNLLMYTCMVEVADNCYLSPTARTDPRLQAWNEQAGLIFGLMNDALSSAKEDTGAPVLNAVLMHREQYGTTTENSIESVAEWHMRKVEELEIAAEELTRDHGRPVAEYIGGVQRLLAGITSWTRESPRYGQESVGRNAGPAS